MPISKEHNLEMVISPAMRVIQELGKSGVEEAQLVILCFFGYYKEDRRECKT
jgi:hypothetical protein